MAFVSVFVFVTGTSAGVDRTSPLALHTERTSPSDLEVAGDLQGLRAGTTRYVTRQELLALAQVSYMVADDSNFTRPTLVSGVPLEELARRLAGRPESDLVAAICDDRYRSNYPREYIAAHHPLLVLEVDGKPPAGWPKDSEKHRFDMGPYLISHPQFTPSFKILSHADEAQIPWGVVRIEFRDQKEVFGVIAPRGPHATDRAVEDGYRIAQQNCFRCHNMGTEGGQKSGVAWAVLAALASHSGDFFGGYVRDPRSKNPQAMMPGRPDYDDATIRALGEYFRTFQGPEEP
jgi:mono/diheme cytochrome c family protein